MTTALAVAELPPVAPARRRVLARRALHSPSFLAGAGLTALTVLAAVLAPWISPYPPDAVDPFHILGGFSAQHLLGTDDLGRDELSRLLWAGRTDLAVGVLAVLFPSIAGTIANLHGLELTVEDNNPGARFEFHAAPSARARLTREPA